MGSTGPDINLETHYSRPRKPPLVYRPMQIRNISAGLKSKQPSQRLPYRAYLQVALRRPNRLSCTPSSQRLSGSRGLPSIKPLESLEFFGSLAPVSSLWRTLTFLTLDAFEELFSHSSPLVSRI